ncbi:TRAF3 interacting protein 1 [Echinococcus multilocularis]|uniref:TRAF3 interacting protein 1 n=1 Tax=Echinococcus multilocularis TaxID=6211 RepID=A0A087VY61_ECHMU|nr:TRAF3 interacting protein 1 [Echinococcus multilocularis]
MKGLFTAEELNVDCIKDKDAKSAFLKKVIDYVTAAHNLALDVKVGSIISGKEAERTNVLLQLLAGAVNKGVDNAACVNKALGVAQIAKESPSKCDKKEKKKETTLSRVNSFHEPAKRAATEIRKRNPVSSRSKDRNGFTQERQKDRPSNTCSDVTKEVFVKAGDEVGSEPTVQLPGPSNNGPERSTDLQPTPNVAEGVVTTSPQSRTSRPSSAKGLKKPITEPPQFEKQAAKTDLSAKPSPGQNSIKAPTPDPPVFAEFPKEKTQELVEPTGPNALPSSSVAGIMVENEIFSDDEDEDDVRRVEGEEENVLGIRQAHASGGEGDFSDVEDIGQANGALVSKLLRAKKELGGEGTLHPTGSKQSNLIVVNEVAKKRDREATEREMERLCQILQNLTRSALPLGKLIDLMQEDFECIQTEYREWKEEVEQQQQQIRKMEGKTDLHLAQLQKELTQFEQKQSQYRRAIASVKANILNNDQTIQQMLIQSTETS